MEVNVRRRKRSSPLAGWEQGGPLHSRSPVRLVPPRQRRPHGPTAEELPGRESEAPSLHTDEAEPR